MKNLNNGLGSGFSCGFYYGNGHEHGSWGDGYLYSTTDGDGFGYGPDHVQNERPEAFLDIIHYPNFLILVVVKNEEPT